MLGIEAARHEEMVQECQADGRGGYPLCDMATPYPTQPDDAGTALLFPPHDGVYAGDVSAPDLSKAASALYFGDESRWPATDGGSIVPLPTHMVDSPDAAALANYIAQNLPLGAADTWGHQAAPVTEHAPYVNPANCVEPDAVYALNWLYDHAL